MKNGVVVTADKVNKRRKISKLVRISLLFLLLLLIIMYIILGIVYSEGKFTVILDKNMGLEKNVAIYESLDDPTGKRKLGAKELEFMDNISIKWLPKNITKGEGSHNGDNYIAYSFYVENQGKEIVNYWYEVNVLDVVKNVDEAIRIIIYENDDRVVYAKKSKDGEIEKGTTPFKEGDTIILKKRADFNPKDLDKITVVVFLEGDDPECVDSILGGEMKMEMHIREEHINKY